MESFAQISLIGSKNWSICRHNFRRANYGLFYGLSKKSLISNRLPFYAAEINGSHKSFRRRARNISQGYTFVDNDKIKNKMSCLIDNLSEFSKIV